MNDESYVCIFAREIYARVRIGIHGHEKQGTQGLLVSARLYADLSYLSGLTEQTIINYDDIYKAVKAWESRPHTGLIETYLKELLKLAFAYPQVTAARISIGKPDTYEDAAQAGVEVFMRRGDYKL